MVELYCCLCEELNATESGWQSSDGVISKVRHITCMVLTDYRMTTEVF